MEAITTVIMLFLLFGYSIYQIYIIYNVIKIIIKAIELIYYKGKNEKQIYESQKGDIQ